MKGSLGPLIIGCALFSARVLSLSMSRKHGQEQQESQQPQHVAPQPTQPQPMAPQPPPHWPSEMFKSEQGSEQPQRMASPQSQQYPQDAPQGFQHVEQPQLPMQSLKVQPTDELQQPMDGNDPSLVRKSGTSKRNLAFVHIPFNFGHTVERVAMFRPNVSNKQVENYVISMGGWGGTFGVRPTGKMSVPKDTLNFSEDLRPNGESWGHFADDLQLKSPTTGCDLYYTPQKYWPIEVAERYFGGKKIFGLLRDPFERLVSIFRGQVAGYGSFFDPKILNKL